MIARLPLKGIFTEFEFLSPEIAFNKARTKLNDLPLLCEKFKHLINVNLALDEWRLLPFTLDEDDVNMLTQLPLDEMWQKISVYKDFNDVYKFKNIAKLATIVLTLPHSNAEAERIFSITNDVKTKKRNRLGDETLNAITLIRSSFSALNLNCTTFKPCEDHFKLFSNAIYKKNL